MALPTSKVVVLSLIYALLNISCQGQAAALNQQRKVYMVFLDSTIYSTISDYASVLRKVLEGSTPSECLVQRYSREFDAFAAKLTEKEAQKLAGIKGVLSVMPDAMVRIDDPPYSEIMIDNQNFGAIPSPAPY